MANYKLAIQRKERFQTNKGLLSMEQLCDLSINELNDLAVSLDEEYNKSGKKSFIGKNSDKDKITKFKLEIVLDILYTKMEEQEAATTAQEVKAHNEKIITLIAEKQDESLKGKSIKQLEAMLK